MLKTRSVKSMKQHYLGSNHYMYGYTSWRFSSQIKYLKLSNPNFLQSPLNQAMSNPSSLTLHEVIGNVVEEVLRERVEERNQEIFVEVMSEEIEVVVEEREARAYYSNNGEEAFKKHLAKKGYVEERGFIQLILPFKKEVDEEAGKH